MALPVYGGIEAGGTKMVLVTGDRQGHILEQLTIPTMDPVSTCDQMIAFFRPRRIAALGIAAFGPIQPDPARPRYGDILTTPKPGWRDFPLLSTLQSALQVPCCIDTDVNGAALGESVLGAAKGLKNCLYLTIGTGIGGGLICEGNLVHGAQHPEWGHMLLRPHPSDPAPDGFCPYHKGCLEGLAGGPAIEKRWGVSAKQLPADHPAWALEAEYLAQVCAIAFMTVSPQMILLGGGVMSQPGLLPLVRSLTAEKVNDYLVFSRDIPQMIRTPALFPLSGAYGALLLALRAGGISPDL